MKHRFLSLLCCATALISPSLQADDGVITVTTQATIDIPISYHMVAGVDPDARYIQIEDQSQWKISESDVYTAMTWSPGQFVLITPNRRWFSEYDYFLTNQVTGTYVSANLLRGPLHDSPYAHHISGTDCNKRGKKVIMLDNKTYWSVSSDDHYVVDGWEINDMVIIGTNDTWFTSYDTILIDVETNTHVKARRM